MQAYAVISVGGWQLMFCSWWLATECVNCHIGNAQSLSSYEVSSVMAHLHLQVFTNTVQVSGLVMP